MLGRDFRQDPTSVASYHPGVDEVPVPTTPSPSPGGLTYAGAAAALTTRRAALIARWMQGYQDSRLRLPRRLDLDELSGAAEGLCEALGAGLGDSDATPGHGALREAEKRVAFIGGSFGMAGASAFDLSAFVLALRDALAVDAASEAEQTALVGLFDWFCALALEGFATSREDALRLRHRDELERGTPLVMITHELPAALLVGDPDRAVLESIFGRLLLSIVRVGARAVIVDGQGLTRATDERVLESLTTFARHRKVEAGVLVVLTGLPPDAEASWQEACGPTTRHQLVERFDDAVATALAAYGLKVGKR
jgi:hypothetical protein